MIAFSGRKGTRKGAKTARSGGYAVHDATKYGPGPIRRWKMQFRDPGGGRSANRKIIPFKSPLPPPQEGPPRRQNPPAGAPKTGLPSRPSRGRPTSCLGPPHTAGLSHHCTGTPALGGHGVTGPRRHPNTRPLARANNTPCAWSCRGSRPPTHPGARPQHAHRVLPPREHPVRGHKPTVSGQADTGQSKGSWMRPKPAAPSANEFSDF